MNIRNARHANDGSITIEYEHPIFGWIPFSARFNDSEKLGRDLYALALTGTVASAPSPTADEIAAAAKASKDLQDALNAKADAKLAALAAMTPFPAVLGSCCHCLWRLSSVYLAPRSLNEPVNWSSSVFRKTFIPVSSLKK